MIGAIVLAAGQSRRMGAQKLLLPWSGQPLVAHVVDQVLGSPTRPVIVVVSHEEPAIAAALAGRPVTLVHNPVPGSEMLASVRCGLQALGPACQAALVVLGDQPGVTSPLIGRLIVALQNRPASIVVPQFQGRRGHPILLPQRFFAAVLQRYDGIGLRGLLREYPHDVTEVPIDASQALDDMDTPDDYRRLRRPR